MCIDAVKTIVAKILFIESSDEIDENACFDELGFSSIDFIDLCFEIKSQINPLIEPNDIWPFKQMMVDPALYNDGEWTMLGLEVVHKTLAQSGVKNADAGFIERYWTPAFCAKRIELAINA